MLGPAKNLLTVALATSLLFVSACDSNNTDSTTYKTPTPAPSAGGNTPGLQLKVLHINDHHSHLQADTGTDHLVGPVNAKAPIQLSKLTR